VQALVSPLLLPRQFLATGCLQWSVFHQQ
jgi:hypothetical protein